MLSGACARGAQLGKCAVGKQAKLGMILKDPLEPKWLLDLVIPRHLHVEDEASVCLGPTLGQASPRGREDRGRLGAGSWWEFFSYE